MGAPFGLRTPWDGQAFNFSFLLALRRGMKCYFEKMRGAFPSAVDIEVARRLIVWDRAMERRSRRRLHEARDEANSIFRAVCLYEGEDTANDAFLNGIELVRGALEDTVPEHHP
ncbi:hypothetical protein LIER_07617 [Lithospermum erythrorhizon]|uniref:Uncharacterized protein n=1 Tax=Lithospermum erythrorhizon TaxID=34254 RepID=A0AAV3PDG3_LITER